MAGPARSPHDRPRTGQGITWRTRRRDRTRGATGTPRWSHRVRCRGRRAVLAGDGAGCVAVRDARSPVVIGHHPATPPALSHGGCRDIRISRPCRRRPLSCGGTGGHHRSGPVRGVRQSAGRGHMPSGAPAAGLVDHQVDAGEQVLGGGRAPHPVCGAPVDEGFLQLGVNGVPAAGRRRSRIPSARGRAGRDRSPSPAPRPVSVHLPAAAPSAPPLGAAGRDVTARLGVPARRALARPGARPQGQRAAAE